MTRNEKFYLTTAIPYVNAKPHIGFALELLQADVVARHHRQSGREVFFLTGADENSLKNVQAAEKAGMATREFVDQNTARFVELTKTLQVSNDGFIRTVDPKHFAGCQKLWQACKAEDIYKKSYTGLYCVGCEAFYLEGDLVDGKCPEHKIKPDRVEEENYFFKLSNYQQQLEQLIARDEYQVVPATRKNEVLSFIRMGLQDFSISRSRARAKDWGVPVPGDAEQVMYVWFDALSNYLTGIGYGSDDKQFNNYWPADLHVIGKGIIRFHAVYWPAMLLSAGIPPPKKLFVHGYINVAGQKMSKSLGTVVDPFDLVERYGAEAVRYFLLRYIHPVQDSDFSEEQFKQAYNADLANGLGNVVQRVASLIGQNDISMTLMKPFNIGSRLGFNKNIDDFRFDNALMVAWNHLKDIDSVISLKKPWELARQKETKELKQILQDAAQDLLEVAYLLEPFLPDTAEKIEKIFTAKKITAPEKPLFPRLQ